MIALGEACDVAYNVRRVFGVEAAHFFDWHVTPFSGLMAAIAQDLAGVGDQVVLRKNRNTAIDAAYRIQLQHAFTRGADGLVAPETVDREHETVKRKIAFLRARWLETLASDDPILFVMRHDVDQAQVEALYALLASKTAGSCHLRCVHYPHQADGFVERPGVSHAVVREGRSWQGDEDSWNDALKDIDLAGSQHAPA